MSAFKQGQAGAPAGQAAANASTANPEAHDKARSARKRTKTGCLTCRKRRIKCDETKPVCRNCQKSKRQCEGYNQRVVFKPADFQHLPHGGARITFDAGMGQDGHGNVDQSATYSQHAQPRSLSLTPQSSQQYENHGETLNHQQSTSHPHHGVFIPPSHGIQQSTAQFPRSSSLAGLPFSSGQSSLYSPSQVDSNSTNPTYYQTTRATDPSLYPNHQFSAAGWQQNDPHDFQPVLWSDDFIADEPPTPGSSQWQQRIPARVDVSRTTTTQPRYAPFGLPADVEELDAEVIEGTSVSPSIYQPELCQTGILDQAAIEKHDDDYYDVDTEDEMYDIDVEFGAQDLQDQRERKYNQANLANNGLEASKMDARYFDGFVFNGTLDSYRPEQVANPLKNPATARVFAHFISETSAILTSSARQTWKTNSGSGNKPVLECIWTYDMPMAALHHQGLLQSILAISSLQMAKLQGASETPSLKHYAYALKRIHHSLGNPKKRLSVPVLAASLLLGYYEIMAAHHANWQSHLKGARQLVVETDFAGMTKMLRQMKIEKARPDQHPSQFSSSTIPNIPDDPQDLILDQMYEADESVVSRMCGIGINYATYGHVGEGNISSHPADLQQFDALRDLYWWYCKQDIYHSLISSDPLLMDYSRFTDCPPRAPLGKPDAPYGSFDHLLLLLARIADFASRDRKRKVKAAHASSSPGQSHTGLRTSASPRQGHPSASPSHGPFSARSSDSPTSSTSHDFIDLNVATTQALQEWNSIREALEFFNASLGPYFQPLYAEFQTPVGSPFGPALFYRTWDLSVFWTVYHMAMIAALRTHPYMPPAAHVAAAAAAPQTREHALLIGRIAAGIILPPPGQAPDPRMSAALVDMIIPLFFAGVQYTDPAHRAWHVERLFETHARTGWATAGIIAEGCQSGWIRAAEAGRGPPHVRVRKATFSDFRIGRYGKDFTPVEQIQGSISDLDAENDRKFVKTKASARVHWAIGLMGTEEDVQEESD